jgi:hypothetical protein
MAGMRIVIKGKPDLSMLNNVACEAPIAPKPLPAARSYSTARGLLAEAAGADGKGGRSFFGRLLRR